MFCSMLVLNVKTKFNRVVNSVRGDKGKTSGSGRLA